MIQHLRKTSTEIYNFLYLFSPRCMLHIHSHLGHVHLPYSFNMCFGNGIVMEKIETVSDNNGVKFEPTLELNSPAAYLQYKNVLKLKRFLLFIIICIRTHVMMNLIWNFLQCMFWHRKDEIGNTHVNILSNIFSVGYNYFILHKPSDFAMVKTFFFII